MKDKRDTEGWLKITNPDGAQVTFAPIPPALSVSSLETSEYSSYGDGPKYESYGVVIFDFNDEEE